MGTFAAAMPFQGQCLVVPVTADTWRDCVTQRLDAVDIKGEHASNGLANVLCTLNGRVLAEDHSVNDLVDVTLRVRESGLPGGMPTASGASEFAKMPKKELMERAKELGVETRRTTEAGIKTWRLKPDVVRDCVFEAAERQASSSAGTRERPQDSSTDPSQALPGSSDNKERPSDSATDRSQALPGTKTLQQIWQKKPGPAKVPDEIPQASHASAPKQRIVLRPKWLRSQISAKKDRELKSTPAYQKKDRERKRTPAYQEKNRELKRQKKIAESQGNARIQYARAQREEEVISAEGSWQQTALKIAEAEGANRLPIMPPSFAALNDEQCLRTIKQMYEFLHLVKWETCVVCWRAWYAVPVDYPFHKALGKAGEYSSWYHPFSSVILGAHRKKNVNRWLMDSDGCQHEAARQYLEHNYPSSVCEAILARIVDAAWKRDAVICKSCAPHVQDGVLQTPVPIRLCDYAVDPVFVRGNDNSQTLSAHCERWQDHESDEASLKTPSQKV